MLSKLMSVKSQTKKCGCRVDVSFPKQGRFGRWLLHIAQGTAGASVSTRRTHAGMVAHSDPYGCFWMCELWVKRPVVSGLLIVVSLK